MFSLRNAEGAAGSLTSIVRDLGYSLLCAGVHCPSRGALRELGDSRRSHRGLGRRAGHRACPGVLFSPGLQTSASGPQGLRVGVLFPELYQHLLMCTGF